MIVYLGFIGFAPMTANSICAPNICTSDDNTDDV